MQTLAQYLWTKRCFYQIFSLFCHLNISLNKTVIFSSHFPCKNYFFNEQIILIFYIDFSTIFFSYRSLEGSVFTTASRCFLYFLIKWHQVAVIIYKALNTQWDNKLFDIILLGSYLLFHKMNKSYYNVSCRTQ